MPRNTHEGTRFALFRLGQSPGRPLAAQHPEPSSFYRVTRRKVALTGAVCACGGRMALEIHPPICPGGFSGLRGGWASSIVGHCARSPHRSDSPRDRAPTSPNPPSAQTAPPQPPLRTPRERRTDSLGDRAAHLPSLQSMTSRSDDPGACSRWVSVSWWTAWGIAAAPVVGGCGFGGCGRGAWWVPLGCGGAAGGIWSADAPGAGAARA